MPSYSLPLDPAASTSHSKLEDCLQSEFDSMDLFRVLGYLRAGSCSRADLIWVSWVLFLAQALRKGSRTWAPPQLLHCLQDFQLLRLVSTTSSSACLGASGSLGPASILPCPFGSPLSAVWDLPSKFPPQPGPNSASLSFHCDAPR